MKSNKCESCGNEYDKAITVVVQGQTHTFDCFECAINVLAPHCEHCDTRVIGHGVEENGRVFCCAHCAESMGSTALRDRVDHVQ